ncbi:LysR family transcriptional regulator protein (plasmid) [Rhizobium etli 8C-3]|uniref:LysR family transcriptional regulator protein n=2 Tax=Rhizobium TaxID=379 RepID=A0A1L5PI93_RHIET|nr:MULTISPECIES: LysR family transcriptional regulator [Rhizobium]APO79750.1 LysR family transcriptional regulator protein [Rhizobium etli 8C-3]TCU41445.1 DNA-binding transcriptional LysR family regulator [Rhizobium azibense]
MDINQVRYLLNLAETLNFTEAARRSGVSQPSLTRAIQRLEEELGSPLIYRDGKDSRLTALGRDIQAEFMRIELALRNVREHSESTTLGRRRILDIAVAPTIGPGAFTAFFDDVLGQLPSVKINMHQLAAGEGVNEVLSGKYHACILPRAPRPNHKLKVVPLFRERFLLACAESHPLARHDVVSTEALSAYPYVDRLACEFHTEITEHLMDHDAVMQPRFSTEREDWVQRIVAEGRAICIIPERSAVAQGIALREVEGISLEREVVFVMISGSGTPLEIRKIAQLADRHDWGRGKVP